MTASTRSLAPMTRTPLPRRGRARYDAPSIQAEAREQHTAEGSSDSLEAEACRLEASGRYRVYRRLEDVHIEVEAIRDGGPLIALIHGRTLDERGRRMSPPDVVAALATCGEKSIGRIVAVMRSSRRKSLGQGSLPFPGASAEAQDPPGFDLADVQTRIVCAVSHDPTFRSAASAAFPWLDGMPWASSRDVDWVSLGSASSSLADILATLGLYGDLDKPVVGCHALATILMPNRWRSDVEPPLAQLRRNLDMRKVRVLATGRTWELRDAFRSRGWRWSDGTRGTVKGWTVVVPLCSAPLEIAWAREHLHRIGGHVTVEELSA
jgi:DNA polymerase III subunit epsilon